MQELPADVLRTLIDNAQDIVYCCDNKGRFTYVNPAAVELMGYPAGELEGRHYLTLVAENHRPPVELFYRRQATDRQPHSYLEFPAVARTGAIVWVGQHVQLTIARDGSVAGFQAIARDITRRHQAEARLEESERAYRSLIDGATYGIYRTNAQGAFTYVNPALVRMLGYESPSELLAMPDITELYRDPAVRFHLIEEAQHAGRVTGVEVEWKRRDGRSRLVRLSARSVSDANGRFDGFEVVVEDITERRRADQEREHLQRMEAVVQLAGGVAHHFNNALMAITGFAELLLQRHGGNLDDREDLQEILDAGQRASIVTHQLLALSRREAGTAKIVELNELVGSVEGVLAGLAGPTVTLRCTPAARPARVLLAPRDAEQILVNLVTNARDAMPAGGTVRVQVSVSDHGTAELKVVDDGAGMTAATRDRAFEPFFSTKRQDQGTGLGLSLVYGIVHGAGGSIAIDSEPGRGTTVEISLPLARETTRPTVAEPPAKSLMDYFRDDS